MILKLLKWLFKSEKEQFKPQSYGEISLNELHKLIPMEKIKDGVIYLKHPKLFVTDFNYKLPRKEDIETFLKNDWTNLKKFKEETFDCDEFAMILLGRLNEAFPGFAVGYAQSYNHVFNLFIDHKKQVYIIEPQSDKIFKPKKEYKGKRSYKLQMVLI